MQAHHWSKYFSFYIYFSEAPFQQCVTIESCVDLGNAIWLWPESMNGFKGNYWWYDGALGGLWILSLSSVEFNYDNSDKWSDPKKRPLKRDYCLYYYVWISFCFKGWSQPQPAVCGWFGVTYARPLSEKCSLISIRHITKTSPLIRYAVCNIKCMLYFDASHRTWN